ncbi:MAG: LuxR C-terminal-related transcriptional regulator [Pseudonocardia sp.]
MLAGFPGAERLHQAVRKDPAAPLTVAITGPGGCGKSALLGAVSDSYAAAGVQVLSAKTAPARLTGTDVAVIVDDAHTLSTTELNRLRTLVDRDGARLAVAYRPWPRPPCLAELVTALRRSRPAVVLEHLDRDAVRARAQGLLGAEPPQPLIDLLISTTGGLPLLVDHVVTALQDSGALQRSEPLTVPWQVVDQLRYELDDLEDGPRALMLAVAVGSTLDSDVLSPVLGVPVDSVRSLVDQTRASGLLLGNGTLVPLARQAMLTGTPAERARTVQRALLDVQIDRGWSVIDLARGMVGTGLQDVRVATVLADAGDQALRSDPALAATLYREAVAAGSPALPLSARRAEAAALTGDLDTALQLADEALTAPDAPDLARSVTVAAAVLAHRGLLTRSAELYRWLGPARTGSAAPLAALALIGTGHPDEAETMLAASKGDRPPTLLAGAEELMARGVQESLAGVTSAALSTLTRAAALLEPTGRTVLLPDTPAALAALVALHCGELNAAESVLLRALAHDLGGPAARSRHRLLLAWTAMSHGRADLAQQYMAEAAPANGEPEPRDELFTRALQVGIARRASDLPGMAKAWSAAREAIVRHPVDLFALLPLGELAVAAARLRDQERLTPHLDAAWALLARLGDPVLWSSTLHWSGVHAALYTENSAELKVHADALVHAARTSTYARALATAGRAWVRVLTGDVEVPAVEAAARGLQAVGLGWDGCRLAGQAAIRADDARARVSLLQCARALQTARPGRTDDASSADSPAPPAPRTPGGTLSERERDVAKLMLGGLTYREIGARLYISAKTVEHHVARMRQRIGAANRSELFAHLRALLADDGDQAAG